MYIYNEDVELVYRDSEQSLLADIYVDVMRGWREPTRRQLMRLIADQ